MHAVRGIGDERDRNAVAIIERKLSGPERDEELQGYRAGQLVQLGVARSAQLQRLRPRPVF